MAAGDPLLNYDEMINKATGGDSGTPESIPFFKDVFVAGAAPGTLVTGKRTSLWRYQGSPCGGAIPTAAAVCTNTMNGALRQAASAGSRRKRFLSLVVAALQPGSLYCYDRLSHSAGLSGTAAGAQTTQLPTAALTRYTTGIGVEAWVEIYTQIGASSTTFTTSYTSDTTAGRTSAVTPIGNTGNREAERLIPIPLQQNSGDRGVRSVESLTLAATTGTVGEFGITLARPLFSLPMSTLGVGRIWNAVVQAGGPLDLGVNSDACIAFWWLPNVASAASLTGMAFFMEK